MEHATLEIAIAVVSGINLPLIVIAVRRLGQIRDHLAQLNGRVTEREEHARAQDIWIDWAKEQIEQINKRCLAFLSGGRHSDE